MTVIIAALIAAGASIIVAILTLKQNSKINETHKQVSENSHKNSQPTILDLIADVREEQRETNKRVGRIEEFIFSQAKEGK